MTSNYYTKESFTNTYSKKIKHSLCVYDIICLDTDSLPFISVTIFCMTPQVLIEAMTNVCTSICLPAAMKNITSPLSHSVTHVVSSYFFVTMRIYPMLSTLGCIHSSFLYQLPHPIRLGKKQTHQKTASHLQLLAYDAGSGLSASVGGGEGTVMMMVHEAHFYATCIPLRFPLNTTSPVAQRPVLSYVHAYLPFNPW